jgi:transposase
MTIIRIGLDTAKHVFQVHGVDENEQTVVRRQLRRGEMEKFFGKLAPTRIGLEACGASHYWARLLRGLGHEVVLLPPQYIKPYVKRGKNDANDAEAICEAMSRPGMRFVPIKSAESQAELMLLGVRNLLIKQRTTVINAIRGHAAEFGVIAAKGPENALSQCLASQPGIGPIGAVSFALRVTDPKSFRSGRHFAAWLGLTPKDHSSGGRHRQGRISRQGNEALRKLVVLGATAVIRFARPGHASPWLLNLLARKPKKLAAIALANKMARTLWAMMVSGEVYRRPLPA